MFTDMALLVLQLLIEHMMPTDQLWDLVVKWLFLSKLNYLLVATMFTITDEHDLSGLCIKSIHIQ